MKKSAFILLTVILLASCTGKKDTYTINGVIKGVDSGVVYLQKLDADEWVKIDSAVLEKGEFTFKGKAGMPEMWFLTTKEKQVFLPLFVENATISVEIFSDSIDKSTIKGSSTQDIYDQFGKMNEDLNLRIDSVYALWKKAKEEHDTLAMKVTDSISTELDKEMKQNLIDFVRQNNKTVVSPYLLKRNVWQFELPELEFQVTVLDASLDSCIYTQSLKKRIEILKRVSIGQPAPDFSLPDTAGTPLNLSCLQGKILLIDFWASWCSPCRAENPNVVKAYQAYHKKGFSVLGVSFDTKRERWIMAINDDNLTWDHVSDLKGWGNAAGKLYGIASIPSNVLLDCDQKIIARNLKGADLMKKLEELLGLPQTPGKSKGKK